MKLLLAIVVVLLVYLAIEASIILYRRHKASSPVLRGKDSPVYHNRMEDVL